MNVEQVAKVCHETNKAYCDSIGDTSQKHWDEAEDWQRESAVGGVNYAIANPDAPASAQHEAWYNDKVSNGWKYGAVKDADKKEHPCLLPFDKLPAEQRVKDYLFKAVVSAFQKAEIDPQHADSLLGNKFHQQLADLKK